MVNETKWTSTFKHNDIEMKKIYFWGNDTYSWINKKYIQPINSYIYDNNYFVVLTILTGILPFFLCIITKVMFNIKISIVLFTKSMVHTKIFPVIVSNYNVILTI